MPSLTVITAGRDTIFPPSQYAASIAALSHVTLLQENESDHGFSASRPWLVRAVTDWLVARLDA